jgi:hypothetical protein
MSENTSTDMPFASNARLISPKNPSPATIGSVTSNGLLNPLATKCPGSSPIAPTPNLITVGKLNCRMTLKSVLIESDPIRFHFLLGAKME